MLEDLKDNLHNADGTKNDNQTDIINAINEGNAEENENDTSLQSDNIELKDYDAMDMDQLVLELNELIKHQDINKVKDAIEQVRKSFLNQYNDLIDEKKTIFIEQNPDASLADFSYELPAKIKFDDAYAIFKNKRHKHYQAIAESLKNNLKERRQIIEELKSLIDESIDYQASLKPFNQLKERWKNSGPIPRDQYNIVWNDYHFHLERFYDQLHLDREARDKEFQLNLEYKQRLIDRAKELLEYADIHKAFKELQVLHRVWKEEVGPVSREHREAIWEEFSNVTKQLHEKREAFYEELQKQEEQNYLVKKEIIQSLKGKSNQNPKNHSEWQQLIKEVESLREQFMKAGRVPSDKQDEIWTDLKEELRAFNQAKNIYYKDIKKDQQENLKIRLQMIEKVNELKDSTDFETVTPILKKLQEDWKKVGHVPKKHADDLWKQFKDSCNYYFDRFHEYRKEHVSEEMENFNKKKAYLEELRSFTLEGDHHKDLEAIKKHIENWKAIGPVPQFRRHIEGKFNKILDALFDKLSMSKRESELVRYNNRLASVIEQQDNRKIQMELNFVQKKIEEVQSDILQLQNNSMFISNAKSDNPFIKEINKNIERHKEELELWKEKQEIIKNLLNN